MTPVSRRSLQQYATPDALPAGQQAALTALLAGRSVTAAAATAGVDRTTLHRWLKADFAFQAAFNRARRDLHVALQARLLALAEQAAEAVEKAVRSGDTKAAMAVLKGLGFLAGEQQSYGGDDPQELAKNAAEWESMRELFSPGGRG